MNIQFHLTNACNLRCKHCYQGEYTKKLISLPDFITVLEKTKRYFESKHDFIDELMITGGEPLCVPDIQSYMLSADSFCRKLNLMTNGVLLTPKHLECFKKAIHFHAVNDSIRGIGTYKKIQKAIQYINDAGLISSVSCTLASYNYNRIGELYDDLIAYDPPTLLWFDRCIPFKGTDTLTKEQFKYFIDTLRVLRQRWKEEKLPTVPSANRALQWLAGDAASKKYACQAGLFHYTIMHNGDVMICRRLNFSVGNLLKEDWPQIMERTIPILKEIHAFPDECMGCQHVRFCHGGLKCLTYALHHNFNAKDVNCPF